METSVHDGPDGFIYPGSLVHGKSMRIPFVSTNHAPDEGCLVDREPFVCDQGALQTCTEASCY